MKLEQLYDLYGEGKIPKRLYWELARERLVPLLEIRRLLEKNPYCRSVEIRADGIVLRTRDIALFSIWSRIFAARKPFLSARRGKKFRL